MTRFKCTNCGRELTRTLMPNPFAPFGRVDALKCINCDKMYFGTPTLWLALYDALESFDTAAHNYWIMNNTATQISRKRNILEDALVQIASGKFEDKTDARVIARKALVDAAQVPYEEKRN